MKPSVWLALHAALLGGCIQNEYDIEMQPAGKLVERTLTIKRQSGDVAADELKRVSQEYSVAPPDSAKRHVFKGRFSGKLPNDVGGRGSFTRWDTPLGSAVIYVERFRGDDDAAEELKRRQAAADRLSEVVTGWLESELKNEPQWPTLQQFLNEDLRRDLYNVSIYAWTMSSSGEPAEAAETWMRISQYLVERDYVTPDEIPAIKRAFDDANREDYQRLLKWLQKSIVARMDRKQKPPPTWEFLATPSALLESLNSYLETTEEYARLERDWHEKLKAEPATAAPESLAVLTELVVRLFSGAIAYGGDQLTVAIKTGRAPILTNGHSTHEATKVEWPAARLPGMESLPTLAYAVWDEPNETAQKKIFGKIVLQGKNLLEYCTWYHGLTAAEKDEWDQFLVPLRPGPTLVQDLEGFCFDDEPLGGDQNRRLARPVVEAIRGELAR